MDGKLVEALALVGLLAGIQLVLVLLGLTGFGLVGTSRKTGEIVATWFKVARVDASAHIRTALELTRA